MKSYNRVKANVFVTRRISADALDRRLQRSRGLRAAYLADWMKRVGGIASRAQRELLKRTRPNGRFKRTAVG